MLKGKERKKSKVKQRQIKKILYILKINYKGKRTVGKANKGINVEKIILDLKIKIKKSRKKKENSTELQQPNIEAEVYNNNKKCD